MSDSDLVFQNPPLAQPADLVFGIPPYVPGDVNVTFASGLPPLTFAASIAPYVELAFSGTLPPLTFAADIRPGTEVTLTGTFPAPTFESEFEYSSNTDRPVVGQTAHLHQVAIKTELGWQDKSQASLRYKDGWQAKHVAAVERRIQTKAAHQIGLKLDNPPIDARHAEAIKPGNWSIGAPFAEGVRDRRPSVRSSFQEGIDRRNSTFGKYQEMLRDRRPSVRTSFQSAVPRVRRYSTSHTSAVPYRFYLDGRYQEAIRPPPGIETIVVPPEPPIDPCYIPDGQLVFKVNASSNTNLLFFCETHSGRPPTTTIVVPIRSVYVVINDVWLRRVSGNVMLPTLGLSLSIDADSWTWGFSASLPLSTLDALQPTSTGPVELEVNINGNLYRVLAEKIASERAFGNSSIRVSGRGKTALLAAPYAPVLTFANTQQRTAQQLMADVLTFNNVPLGWSVDWQIDDWLVPADAFNVRGTYIDGLTTIAGAAGAYLKPDPVAQSVSVLLRYPVAPWDWAAEITPEFSLPSSVTVQEGIEWLNKPDYNRVFVSGTSQGVLGQVTREGTAGDLAAPMVTDPLITAAAAARQRGLAVLGDTGKQAMVRLRLPVLESTGVIDPGAFVQYTDGATSRLGLVRSTNVDVSWPDVWQTLELETHL